MSSTVYVCQSCGNTVSKWHGQCSSCGEWNTLIEEVAQSGKGKKKSLQKGDLEKLLVKFSEVKAISGQKQRFSTYIGEMDRVLGGGLVKGSVILLAGEPGVGKSTLLTQVAIKVLLQKQDFTNKKESLAKILYVCGEESPSQISLRISRFLSNNQLLKEHGFAVTSANKLDEQLIFATSNNVDEVAKIINQIKPSLVIIDSIQTLKTEDLAGASGSVGQIRESADRIINIVKPLHIPTFLVGHITKEGSIAGPKILEHMVDVVLEFSGERMGDLRLLRALKNRFGATDEVGVFQINDFGLVSVDNPSLIFLENQGKEVLGAATACVLEGTRPLLVEVQALVVNSQLAMPRRVGRGIELSRIQVLSAVLQKYCRLPLGNTDIFISAAGGFKIKEPAVDLGLAVAIASSLKNRPVPEKTIFIGEIGLLGEIRAVNYLDKRIKEANRLGYTKIISRQTSKTVFQVLKEMGLS